MEILDGSEGLQLLIDYDAGCYEEASMGHFKDLFLNVLRVITESLSKEDVTFGDIKGIIRER